MSEPGLPELPFGAPESADGTLVIIVCRAKHLPNRRKLDKQNPYVSLRIGTTAKKTPSHFRAGQTPEWTHEVRFDLQRDKKPILMVDVLDETKNEPTPIGNASIDVSKIFQNYDNSGGEGKGKFIYDNWFDLTMLGKRAGMIYLEMTFYPSAPILPPKIVDHRHIVKEEKVQFNPQEDDDLYTHPVPPLHHNYNHSNYHHTSNLPPNSAHDIHLAHSKHKSQDKNYFQSKPRSSSPVLENNTSHKTAIDDVFVNSRNSDRSTFLKRLSFLKNSASTNETDISLHDDDAPEVESSKKHGKTHSKWHKLVNKFQSKEPISTLWQGESTSEPEIEYHRESGTFLSPKRSELENIYAADEELMAPLPPPHSVKSSMISNLSISASQPVNKPHNYPRGFNNLTTAVPFSADTIGLADDSLPTEVYFLNKKVQSLTYSTPQNEEHVLNPNEIDPRYYAPSPSEKLNEKFRLQQGRANKNDLSIDLRTSETGYLGNGKFSPNVFELVNHNHSDYAETENKPKVPPKIPRGLTNQEYYVIAKDQYLHDLNGNRV